MNHPGEIYVQDWYSDGESDVDDNVYCGKYPIICNHQCGHSNKECDDTVECADKCKNDG